MLAAGDTAPSFTVPGATAEEISEYSLSAFATEGLTVLSFYPFDFSPVCSEQLCTLRDIEWFQLEDGVDVVGISGDSAYAHQAFAEKHDLPFPLLSDFGGAVADAYGVAQSELDGHPTVPQRSFFVVDDNRRIRYTWLRDEPATQPPIEEVAGEIRALR